MKLFKTKFGEIRSGWVIAAVLILIVIAQLLGASLVPDDGSEESIAVIIGVTSIYCLLTIGGGLLLFKLFYKRSVRQIGLIKKGWLKASLHGLLIGTVSISLVFAVLLLTGQAQTWVDLSRLFSMVTLVNFFSVGFTAFSEELLARGLMMTSLKTTRVKWAILCVPAFIVALIHLLNPGVTLLSLSNTLLASLLFAYMFIKSGALWLPTGFHIGWNFLQGDIFGMNVSGREQLSVFSTTMGPTELLTGGAAGPEGGLLVTLALLLTFTYVKLLVKPSHPSPWTMESDMPLVR